MPAETETRELRDSGSPAQGAESHQALPLLGAWEPADEDEAEPCTTAPVPAPPARCRRARWSWCRVLPAAVLLLLASVALALAMRRPGVRGNSLAATVVQDQVQRLFVHRSKFKLISSGKCADIGFTPIHDKYHCEAAAAELGIHDRSALPLDLLGVPEGCYYLTDRRDGNTGLWLGTNKLNIGKGAETTSKSKGKLRQPICRQSLEPGAATSRPPADAGDAPVAPATSLEASSRTYSTTSSKSVSASRTTAFTTTPLVKHIPDKGGTTTASTPRGATNATWPNTAELQLIKHVLKGISYSPLPDKGHAVLTGDDAVSKGTSAMWSRRGRGDLGLIKALGATAVQLSGNSAASHHGDFLDEALELGLEVIAGLSDCPYTEMQDSCKTTEFNCYSQVKKQYAQNLQKGYLTGGKDYHPALRTLVLMNEPDLKLSSPMEPGLFCRAIASALDAVLDAEKEAGVVGKLPNITATFSFGRCPQCSQFGYRPAVGQMLELRRAMEHPNSVGYKARNNLWEAYQQRFINSFNTATSAHTVQSLFLDAYHSTFQSTPVFVGAYRSARQDNLEEDLKTILDLAAIPNSLLMGLSLLEFQVHYNKDGSELPYGIFGLGKKGVGSVNVGNGELTARCLTPAQSAGPAAQAQAPEAPSQPKCGWVEQDVEYLVDTRWTSGIQDIRSAEACCGKCGEDERCHSWTWLQDLSQCWLKAAPPSSQTRRVRPGFVSGLPPPRSAKAEDKIGVGSNGLKTQVFASIARVFGGPGISQANLCPESETAN